MQLESDAAPLILFDGEKALAGLSEEAGVAPGRRVAAVGHPGHQDRDHEHERPFRQLERRLVPAEESRVGECKQGERDDPDAQQRARQAEQEGMHR